MAPEADAANAAYPFHFEVLPIKHLMVDDSYQRPLTTFVDKIVANFDPALLGTIVVSKRSAKQYAVVDGQTRMEALRELGHAEMPCLVYEKLTQSDEASLFARLQRERRGIASYHRFRAALVAGDEEAIEIERIADDCGYEVGIEPGKISAVAALEYAYRRSPEILERTLLIFQEAWGESEHPTPTGDLIKGLAYLLNSNDKIKDERMAEKLADVTPEAVRRRASAFKEGIGQGGGGAVRYHAQALEAVYRSRG
jgi:hypothetical protein